MFNNKKEETHRVQGSVDEKSARKCCRRPTAGSRSPGAEHCPSPSHTSALASTATTSSCAWLVYLLLVLGLVNTTSCAWASSTSTSTILVLVLVPGVQGLTLLHYCASPSILPPAIPPMCLCPRAQTGRQKRIKQVACRKLFFFS